jgi:hypothetical protein
MSRNKEDEVVALERQQHCQLSSTPPSPSMLVFTADEAANNGDQCILVPTICAIATRLRVWNTFTADSAADNPCRIASLADIRNAVVKRFEAHWKMRG